jgi:membrane associated rhomboid family serine protease
MLPLRDNIPSSRFPTVTVALIIANVLAFLFEVKLGGRVEEFLLDYGIVPVRYTDPGVARHFTPLDQAIPFFSSMFLHGGWLHLIGNMWTLWIFGDNVEDQLGHGKFMALYLIGGLTAGLLHTLTNAGSTLPTIGASGAVAGIMGAYFRFFPHAKVETIIPPFFFIFELPALIFLGWWFVLQFLNGTMTLLGGRNDFGGVAWWAHIGGFLFGLYIAGRFTRRRRRTGVYEPDLWE